MNLQRGTTHLNGRLLTRVSIFLLCLLLAWHGEAAKNPEGLTPPPQRLILIKFKPTTSAQQIHNVEKIFHNLQKRLPGFNQVIWRAEDTGSAEQPFTHSVRLQFSSEQALSGYDADFQQIVFMALLTPLVENLQQSNS